MNVPWSHAPRSLEDGQDFPLQDNQQALGNRQGRTCVTQPTGAFLCLQLADTCHHALHGLPDAVAVLDGSGQLANRAAHVISRGALAQTVCGRLKSL
jgi:hypothetical protein